VKVYRGPIDGEFDDNANNSNSISSCSFRNSYWLKNYLKKINLKNNSNGSIDDAVVVSPLWGLSRRGHDECRTAPSSYQPKSTDLGCDCVCGLLSPVSVWPFFIITLYSSWKMILIPRRVKSCVDLVQYRPISCAAVTNSAGCGRIRLARRRAVTNPAGGAASNFWQRRRCSCGASLSYKNWQSKIGKKCMNMHVHARDYAALMPYMFIMRRFFIIFRHKVLHPVRP